MGVLASGSVLGPARSISGSGRGCRSGCVARRGAGTTTGSPRPHVNAGSPTPASRARNRPHSRRDPRHHLPFADHSRMHRTRGEPVSGGERCRRPPGRPPRDPPRNSSPGPLDRGRRSGRRGPVEPGRGVGGWGGGQGGSTPKLAVMIASNSASTQAGSEQTRSANPLASSPSATASRMVPRPVGSRRRMFNVTSNMVDHFPATSSCSIPGHVPRLSISIVNTGDCVKH